MVNHLDDRLSRVFASLADPTRRAMLAQVALGDASVSELAAPYKISLPAASKHLSHLESAGLIAKHKIGREVRCRFVGVRFKEAMDWMSRYERFWTDQLDALGDYLNSDNTGDQEDAE